MRGQSSELLCSSAYRVSAGANMLFNITLAILLVLSGVLLQNLS